MCPSFTTLLCSTFSCPHPSINSILSYSLKLITDISENSSCGGYPKFNSWTRPRASPCPMSNWKSWGGLCGQKQGANIPMSDISDTTTCLYIEVDLPITATAIAMWPSPRSNISLWQSRYQILGIGVQLEHRTKQIILKTAAPTLNLIIFL